MKKASNPLLRGFYSPFAVAEMEMDQSNPTHWQPAHSGEGQKFQADPNTLI